MVGAGLTRPQPRRPVRVEAPPPQLRRRGEKTFTLDELAQFNGEEGTPAYVAVDGVVYDVSGSARWREGQHTSCPLGAMAGKDLSAEMEQAPSNMRSLLERMTVVGTLVQ